MKGLVLAAGYATRLYPLTKNKAKALLPIKGQPILDYIVDEMWTMPDLEQIIIVSNHRFAKDFEAWRQTRPGEDIVVIDDGTTSDDDKLGAIGDMQYVIDKLKIDDDFFVIAGDTLFTYKLKDAWEAFRETNDDMILACEMPEGEDLTRFAIATVNDQGVITSLEEKPAEPKSNRYIYDIFLPPGYRL